MSPLALLAGPHPALGMESLDDQRARLGALPSATDDLIGTLERSGLRGRGGASFPVGVKWRSVADRAAAAPAIVLVNGAEGEPLSAKDRLLMESRPHLVLDGALLAASAVGAHDIVLYVGETLGAAGEALRRALGQRPDTNGRVRVVHSPARYVAGEESAAVNCVNTGVALPVTTPPRPYESGIAGRPTLVQNVETLAHVALISRRGDGWFRDLGDGAAVGTAMVTVSAGGGDRRIVEVAQGTTIADTVHAAGHSTDGVGAVLLGGFFGGWVSIDAALRTPLDGVALRAGGQSLGCGVVGLLAAGECGVCVTADIAAYLATQSAQQCGPCVFGLHSLSQALRRLAVGTPNDDDVDRLRAWAIQARGRGACRHPDGVAGMVLSALGVFEAEFERHQLRRGCTVPPRPSGAQRWTG
jgi:NADH:ubiquinone oxidoreductase subunit F (NADH-binding)